jgi:thiol:disulfide interchange protein DsbC
MKAHKLLALVTLLFCSIALGANDSAKTAATIKSTLESRYEGLKILDVTPSPLPGLYEVFTGDGIVYSDKTGDRLLVGKLVDTKTKKDLSGEKLDARNAIDFNSLPWDRAIKIVKGDGSRRLAIFADPDCPYCKKLERELQSVNNVTAYVFLYPLTDLHPKANEHAHAIWCSADRSTAWTDWMLKQTPPTAAPCDNDPIAQNSDLGKTLRISQTPTMFLSSGKRIGGALTAAQIEQLITSADGKAMQLPQS